MSPSLIPAAPEPQFVVAGDNVQLATYDEGDPSAPVVLAVHGFASSARGNWYATGWVRELLRGGFRIVSLDQRGHGRSDKPHEPSAYSMTQLVDDVYAVMDTYLLDEVSLVGYSLGGRVGWHAALGADHRIVRAVLGGIPDGYPLTRFRTDEAEAYLADGTPIEDRLTRAYVDMAAQTRSNDLRALVALVRGMQGGLQPDPDRPPTQPVLFATGSLDSILEASQRLAAATPQGEFFEIPGRNHFNAPTSGAFRTRALEFLGSASGERRTDAEASVTAGGTDDGVSRPSSGSEAEASAPAPAVPPTARPDGAGDLVTSWDAGLAALRMALGGDFADTAVLESALRARWSDWSHALGAGRPDRPRDDADPS